MQMPPQASNGQQPSIFLAPSRNEPVPVRHSRMKRLGGGCSGPRWFRRSAVPSCLRPLNANSARFHSILLIADADALQPFNFAPSRDITRFVSQETYPIFPFQISPPPLPPISSWPRPSLSSRARPIRWSCPRRPLLKVP